MTRSEWNDLMRDLPAARRATFLREAPDAIKTLGEDDAMIHLGAQAEIAREAAHDHEIGYLIAKGRVLGRVLRRLRLELAKSESRQQLLLHLAQARQTPAGRAMTHTEASEQAGDRIAAERRGMAQGRGR